MFIISSCEKEIPYGHPTCDTCDWNVLTCKVDGVPWQAKVDCDFLGNCDPVDCQFYALSKFIEFGGRNLENDKGISIHKTNSYVNQILSSEANYFNSAEVGNCKVYENDTTVHSFFQILNLDTTKKIIEGKFEYLVQNDCLSKVKISDGYFKLTYRP